MNPIALASPGGMIGSKQIAIKSHPLKSYAMFAAFTGNKSLIEA